MLPQFLFHFTDGFRAADVKVYYGFVMPRGLSLFRRGLRVEVPADDRLRLGFVDVVHAVMSVLVFVAVALSDHRVSDSPAASSQACTGRRWARR
ncbi:hypothetical protein GUJ93_ZPchr0006g42986 [Zizania palustris]|uniref:Uncharacterized protein n=1 Tax=Zizania palustris TaxID=103762 RepID=A0A8J5VLL7_ZIZPA|nr:hypothetical protein GUJ93_ZPchr0006g42986 [Zizania palustris]